MDNFDHRSLGNDLKLFNFSDHTPGMAFWLPNGMIIRKTLEEMLWKEHINRGYKPIQTPRMMDVELWKISGHYDNYNENMFFSEVEKREYVIAPMNCPGHILIYKSDVKSYRELPLKLFEFGLVHRNEMAGALHGLFRVRSFTQDDAHIFCTTEQITQQIKEVMSFIDYLLKYFEFEYEINFSTKPQKSVGSDENWEKAETSIKQALTEMGLKYNINEGDGAFYGPKIDIKIIDLNNKSWQLSTIQIDFNLPERFGLKYTSEDGTLQTPVMIHRAILGSFERFIGILLEHYKGDLPFDFSPTQISIIPVNNSQEQLEYAEKIKLSLNNIRCNIVNNNDGLNKKIRNEEMNKIPIILVIGDKEVANNTLSIRSRANGNKVVISFDEFVESFGFSINRYLHNLKQPLNAISIKVEDLKYAFENDEIDAEYIQQFQSFLKQNIKNLDFLTKKVKF